MIEDMGGHAEEAVVALVSGGLDSSVLVSYLLEGFDRVIPVYIREGLAWEAAELPHLERFLAAIGAPTLDALRVLDLPMADVLGGHWSLSGSGTPGFDSADEEVYLPGRNLLLVSKAAVLAAREGAGAIALGVLGGNPFPDTTPEFFRAMEQACSSALAFPLRILAPFREMTKIQVMRLGAGLPLELTFSCLAPRGDRPCGTCNKCAERQKLFEAARGPGGAQPRYESSGLCQ